MMECIQIHTVQSVELKTYQNGKPWLVIASGQDTYMIPGSSYEEDFPFVLGERLRQHNRLDKVKDDT
jgi:hypothetical protein